MAPTTTTTILVATLALATIGHAHPSCPPRSAQPLHLPDPTSPAHYFRCVNGERSRLRCPPAAPVFSAASEACEVAVADTVLDVEDNNVPVAISSDSAVCDGSAVFYPYPYDCAKFYQCAHAGADPLVVDCAPGTEFDAALGMCNWPDQANCEATPRPTTDATAATEEPTLATTDDDYNAEYGGEDGDDNDDNDDNITVICGPGDTYFPFPYDCTKYFWCVHGNALVMECSPGTEWDATNNICNWPYAANCVASPRPTTTDDPVSNAEIVDY